MAQSSWFSSSTLNTWLIDHGFTAVAAGAATAAVAEVIAMVDNVVGFSPFLTAGSTSRYFNPPRFSANGYILRLPVPISGAVTISVDWNQIDAAGSAWTQHTDWVFTDLSAAYHKSVRFLSGFSSSPNSVKITGSYGYPDIPDDLYYAALKMAAAVAVYNTQAGASGAIGAGAAGVKKQGPVEFEYGSDKSSFWMTVTASFASVCESYAVYGE